jgi:hypothetical protein
MKLNYSFPFQLALIATLAVASFPAATAESEQTIDSQAAFEKLKGLAGQWSGTTGEKGKGPEATVKYQTTANGSVVMETLFPGTPHEMLTLYHLDNGKLILTHYCALANQPRMALTPKSTTTELDFDFIGGDNIKPGKDTHMHSLHLRFEGKDALAAEWDLFEHGKKSDSKKFFLTRKS